ncbi:hypothetical protein KCP73_19125 [Salmonella enterica subsp. enterica]|nr:hypothetical protein KCP73_19125 [Salmonella enterica subsp. enterica]
MSAQILFRWRRQTSLTKLIRPTFEDPAAFPPPSPTTPTLGLFAYRARHGGAAAPGSGDNGFKFRAHYSSLIG